MNGTVTALPARSRPSSHPPRRTSAEAELGGERLHRVLARLRQEGPPETVAGWKRLAEQVLVDQCCAARRNREISSSYAWAYMQLPTTFKWAGMAALASHHVRVALLPLHLTGASAEPAAGVRRSGTWQMVSADTNTMRIINNAIFDDLFWVHLAYLTSEDGIGLLRDLLGDEARYAPVLAGFEALDEGRRVLEDPTSSPTARARAQDLVWEGNLRLLEHEQSVVVQPSFDRLSDPYSRIISLGSASTFETRGPRRAVEYFTSFYLFTLLHACLGGVPRVQPRITDYDDRWRWLVSSVVPRFRRFDAEPQVLVAILRRILDEDRDHEPSCREPDGRWLSSARRRRSRAAGAPAAPGRTPGCGPRRAAS